MDVDAFDLPPCLARYDLYAFSTGYLDVPAAFVCYSGWVHDVAWFRRNVHRTPCLRRFLRVESLIYSPISSSVSTLAMLVKPALAVRLHPDTHPETACAQGSAPGREDRLGPRLLPHPRTSPLPPS